MAPPDRAARPRWLRWADAAFWLSLVGCGLWAAADREALRVDLTVWWMAPFYSVGFVAADTIYWLLELTRATDAFPSHTAFRAAATLARPSHTSCRSASWSTSRSTSTVRN